MKHGKDWILESFEDRKASVLIGLLCLVYFVDRLFFKGNLIAPILPPWHAPVLLALAGLSLFYQIQSWKKLHHFRQKWYRHPILWLLFCTEFLVVFFAVNLLSWPIYFIYRFVVDPRMFYL